MKISLIIFNIFFLRCIIINRLKVIWIIYTSNSTNLNSIQKIRCRYSATRMQDHDREQNWFCRDKKQVTTRWWYLGSSRVSIFTCWWWLSKFSVQNFSSAWDDMKPNFLNQISSSVKFQYILQNYDDVMIWNAFG